jgi:hypothetical protein
MDNVVSLQPSDGPPPTAAYELCPGPCDEGDTCFCALGMDLVYQGISKLKEKWPAMTEEDAALLVGEMVVGDAACAAQTEPFRTGSPFKEEEASDIARRFAGTLIKKAVSLAFESFNDTADMDARFKAERDTQETIENVLRVRVRDLDWRLRRERRPASA